MGWLEWANTIPATTRVEGSKRRKGQPVLSYTDSLLAHSDSGGEKIASSLTPPRDPAPLPARSPVSVSSSAIARWRFDSPDFPPAGSA